MYSKELLKGTLPAIVLKLLAEKESMYGYEISMRVKELSDGKITIKDGSLYPALQKMTQDGLLSYREDIVNGRVRKYYSITKQGQKERAASMEELKNFIATISKLVFSKGEFA